MSDEDQALRTSLGREKLLDEHDRRLDVIDRRLTDMEQKEARRDKRWDLAIRSLLAIGTGIIIAVATLLIQSGGHL
jgi:hypothetical protein